METYKFNKANWELFQHTLDAKISVKDLENCTIQQIEYETNKWMETVKEAIDKSIPKTTYRPIYQTVVTPEINLLEKSYNILRNNAERYGWTIDYYKEYIRIRHELREKCKEAHTKNWNDKINNIIETSRDTKAFWSKINLLKGRSTKHTNYIEDKEGRRYYSDKEKCNIMENTWKDIFKITEDEANFDTIHFEHIDAYINIHRHRIQPYSSSYLTRPDNNNFYTRPINV